jgi:rod shape-determining protein MreC
VTDRRLLILRTALLWILLELIAAAQVRSPAGELVLWRWIRAAVAPVLYVGDAVGSFVAGTITGVSDATSLVVENNRLLTQLETSRAMNLLMRDDMMARDEIEALIALIPQLAASAVPGRTTHRDLSRGRLVAVVAPGHRIRSDTSAVATGGVIGRVIRSEGRRCWIEIITHPAAAVAVQTRDGTVQGLAVGSDPGEPGILEIRYVPRQARLLRGDEIVTSGADGIHPPGIPVGRVITVRESDRPFLDVRAEPAAQPATARVVLFLDDWTGPHPPVTGRP